MSLASLGEPVPWQKKEIDPSGCNFPSHVSIDGLAMSLCGWAARLRAGSSFSMRSCSAPHAGHQKSFPFTTPDETIGNSRASQMRQFTTHRQ